MLQATKRKHLDNLALFTQDTHQKNDFQTIFKAQTSRKIVKLRPKSRMDLYINVSQELSPRKAHGTRGLKKHAQKFHSESFCQKSFGLENITKRTCLQQSFKEESAFLKDQGFQRAHFLSIDLKQIEKDQHKGVSIKRKAIKLKRVQKHYSPINKLIQLQKLKQKGKIKVLSKQLINIK